jgi:hypothetical protein
MVNDSLERYVRDLVKKGYDIETIRNYLLKHGYSYSDVNGAVSAASSPEVRHIIHFSPTTLISIAVVFLGIIITIFVFFSLSPKDPGQLLDLEIDATKGSVGAGQALNVVTELSNLGSAKRFDVSVKYELINQETSEIFPLKEETIAIETRTSKQTSVAIPSDAKQGNYVLRAIATYDGKRAVATYPLKISRQAAEECSEDEAITCEDGSEIVLRNCISGKFEETGEACEVEEAGCSEDVVKTCSDGSTITISKCADGELEGTGEICETVGDAGDTALSTFETLEKVEKIAKQDREEAERLCRELPLRTSRDLCFNKLGEVLVDRSYCQRILDERTKDVCYSNVAINTGNSDICLAITKDSRKDSCYMNFVIDKKDYTVCSKVVNQYLKQSCESLKQLSKLNITDVAFYESLINQSLIDLV